MSETKRESWHDEAFFGLHYDLHATARDQGLGEALTVEHLLEHFSAIKPDWVQCDCKGHPGWTCWPTKVGSTPPGLVKDMLEIHRDATRRLDIPLVMHYSGVIDRRAVELHPDWATVRADGTRCPEKEGKTCRHSPYMQQLMIPQLLEIIDRYDVDGFWVDGDNWAAEPCWCESCQAEFSKRTGITEIPRAPGDPHWTDWLRYHRELFVEYVTAYAEAVHQRKPDCLVCSNWMYTVRHPEPVAAPVDYLSGDYMMDWGAARAALEGRLLDGRNMGWDLMVWGFTRPYHSSLWSWKPTVHLCQEVSEVLALGGGVSVYGKPERSGWLVDWHHRIIGEVADFCRARKPYCFKTASASECAVLHTADHYFAHNAPLFNFGSALEPAEGGLNALLETHRSADLLTEADTLARLSQYKLLVLPEQTRLSSRLLEALTEWCRDGGHLLLSGGLLADECPELVGADPEVEGVKGEDWAEGQGTLEVDEQTVAPLRPWRRIKPHDGVEVLARLNRGQQPDGSADGLPAVTRRPLGAGSVTAVHGPLFASYFQTHYPLLRRFIARLIEQLNVDWTVTAAASPRLEIVQRRQSRRYLVHLLNRGAGETLSPNRTIIEELPPVEDIRLTMRCPRPPESVSLHPARTEIVWSHQDGQLKIQVPKIAIMETLVIDFAP